MLPFHVFKLNDHLFIFYVYGGSYDTFSLDRDAAGCLAAQ